MKQLFRIAIIFAISMLGEIISALVPLRAPGSVYGLVLMLIALCTGIIPLEAVQTPGSFLLEIMPVMFIPAAAGLIDSWAQLKPILLPVGVIMVVSTFVVMAVSGRVTQAVMRRDNARKKGKEDTK